MICFREADYILLISDTEEQAVEFLGDVRTEFVENEDLINMFGVKKLAKEAQTDTIIEFSDGHKARILAKGAEQKIRGRKWRGKRPNLIVIDDLENEELTESPDRRAKLKRWFYGSVLPAGGDDCTYRYVGTIMHFDSLLESLMPDENDKNTVIEPLRSYNLQGTWKSVKYRAHTDDFKEILWPDKFSEARLRAIRADYVRQGIPEVYAQEYLNVPLSEDNAFFKKGNFRYFEDSEWHWPVYAAADLAISKADRAAYTVMVVARMGPDGRLYLEEVRRGRWDALEIIENMFLIHEAYTPEMFWLEKENIARTLGPVLDRSMIERGTYINIEGVTPTKDKEARARPLQARMRAGSILFKEGSEWLPELETELRRFPKSPYLDQVDALSLLVFGINKMSDPYTSSELEDIEYDEEFGDAIELGRDTMTGY